jgi:hypothetical protein
MAFYYINARTDGTINYVLKYEGKVELSSGEVDISDSPEAEAVFNDPEVFTYKNKKLHRRTDAEMRTRVREIYDRRKSGELHRCKDDLIERFPQYFTSQELEEVESLEDKVKRLEAKLRKREEL